MGGPVPTPEGKKKGPLFWGVVGCCGCLLLLMLMAALGGAGAMMMTSKPVEAVRTTLKDASAGNVDAAYQRMSTSFQGRVSKESFAAFVAEHPGMSTYSDSTFFQRSVKNNTATISGILTASGGSTEAASFELVEEGGDWKIDNLTINGSSPAAGGGPMSDSSAPVPGGDAKADSYGLQLETTSVEKEPVPNGMKVTVTIRASNFETRPQGSVRMVHLIEDLETFAPGGGRIDGLSKEEIQVINRQAAGETQEFVTDITLLEPPDGEYRADITIRDMIGNTSKTEQVTFTLP
jgi:hypothetical protein